MKKLLRRTGILLFLSAFGLGTLHAAATAPSEPDWFRKAFPERFSEGQRKNAEKAASRVNILYGICTSTGLSSAYVCSSF